MPSTKFIFPDSQYTNSSFLKYNFLLLICMLHVLLHILTFLSYNEIYILPQHTPPSAPQGATFFIKAKPYKNTLVSQNEKRCKRAFYFKNKMTYLSSIYFKTSKKCFLLDIYKKNVYNKKYITTY